MCEFIIVLVNFLSCGYLLNVKKKKKKKKKSGVMSTFCSKVNII